MVQFIIVNFTMVHFTMVHFTVMVHFTMVHFTMVHFTMVHFTIVHFTMVHFTMVHFTVMVHFTTAGHSHPYYTTRVTHKKSFTYEIASLRCSSTPVIIVSCLYQAKCTLTAHVRVLVTTIFVTVYI